MNHRILMAASGLALAALATLPGCVVNETSPGGTSYSFGHLDGTLPATPQRVVEASDAVLREEEMHVVSKDATALDGKVVARTALDTQIEVTVKRLDDANSHVSIRVGAWGDAQISRDLFEKIKAKL